MDEKPTFSVISVTRNAACTIRHCVESVKYQEHSAEHIIVDGFSEDKTVHFARKYAQRSATIVSEPDSGPYDAMNKGLALATGDVVGILNSDDFYPHSQVLSTVARAFEDPELDACYGDLIYVDRNDSSRIVRYWKARPFERNLFYRGWMPPHPTFFARRSVYRKHGGFRLDLGSSADYELMLRLLLCCEVKVAYIPELLVVMRTGGISNASLCNRIRANRTDRMAWISNGLRPKWWTLAAKPLSKVNQFLARAPMYTPWLEHDCLFGTENDSPGGPGTYNSSRR